jgi:hypothetical protein
MADWFWWTLYLLAMLLSGAAIAAAALERRRVSAVELAGLMLTLGPAGLASLLLLASLCGARPGRIIVLIFAAASMVVLILLWRRQRLPKVHLPWDFRRIDLLAIPLVLGLSIAVAYVWAMCVGFPLLEWDSIVIWGFKAKVLYYSALTPRPWYFTDLRYNYSHLDYPLLMPMMFAGAYGMMHQLNEYLARLILAILYIGQLLLVYVGARQFLPRVQSLMIAAVVLGAGYNIEQTLMSIPDIIVATFVAGTTVYVLRWIELRQTGEVVLAALFAIFAGITKNEGLPMAAVTAVVVCGFAISSARTRRWWKDPAIFCGIIVVGLGIWLIWRAGIPHVDENYPGQLRGSILAANAGRIPLIVGSGLTKMADVSHWGGLWMLVPILAIVGYRGWLSARTIALWMLLLAHLGIYVLVYVITPWEIRELIRVSMDRLLIHATPVAGLIVAAHWGSLLDPDLHGAEVQAVQQNPAEVSASATTIANPPQA